jgi:hypothetical protein
MKRYLLASYVIASLFPLSVHAQKHSDSGQRLISVGVYGALGVQDVNAPGDSDFNSAILTLGVYGELPRLLLRPGLDLRCMCGDNGVQGMLTGPRISASLAHCDHTPKRCSARPRFVFALYNHRCTG